MRNQNTPRLHYAPTEEMDTYPESDGKPIAETDLHRDELLKTIELLREHFKALPDAYVSGNLMMYYTKGEASHSVSPDVFVSFGVGRHPRRIYRMWQEGKPPDFVLEFSSKGTFRNDLNAKKTLYASALGVREYFLYDVEHLYLPAPLLGFTLRDGVYVPIAAGSDGGILSSTLGLALYSLPAGLGFYDVRASEWLKTPAEKEAIARQRAEAAAQRAESENARLRQELARLKRLEN